MASTILIKYTATGSEGVDVIIPETVSKRILGIWRDGIYKRWVTSTPENQQEIKFDSATGTFTLFPDDIFNINEQLDILIYG